MSALPRIADIRWIPLRCPLCANRDIAPSARLQPLARYTLHRSPQTLVGARAYHAKLVVVATQALRDDFPRCFFVHPCGPYCRNAKAARTFQTCADRRGTRLRREARGPVIHVRQSHDDLKRDARKQCFCRCDHAQGFALCLVRTGKHNADMVFDPLLILHVKKYRGNPARSTGPALFVGGWALAQLWLFWVAPLVGGAIGGVLYRWLSTEPAGQVTGRP